jgi:hypothetical protein
VSSKWATSARTTALMMASRAGEMATAIFPAAPITDGYDSQPTSRHRLRKSPSGPGSYSVNAAPWRAAGLATAEAWIGLADFLHRFFYTYVGYEDAENLLPHTTGYGLDG